MIDSGFRQNFPAVTTIAYLNAGTNGPVPTAAIEAARIELARQCAEGRGPGHYAHRRELAEVLRTRFAELLACTPADVALTSSTTEGIARVLVGLGLRRGDEIVTSDEEHIGLLGPLQTARDVHGIRIRAVPLEAIGEAVRTETKLVALSQVTWISGRVAPTGLGALDVPVLLDGAQGLGAVATDVGELGCAFYAGPAQKWLCGPDGVGLLYVAPAWRDRLAAGFRSFSTFVDPEAGLDATLYDDARRFDAPALSSEALACALTAVGLLAEVGWSAIFDHAGTLARDFASAIAESGRKVCPRGPTTIIGFGSLDAAGERADLLQKGILLRHVPGTQLLRVSVGAWNDETDLEKLLTCLH
jgi:selenocysteine lyase/cysteine desulfurase